MRTFHNQAAICIFMLAVVSCSSKPTPGQADAGRPRDTRVSFALPEPHMLGLNAEGVPVVTHDILIVVEETMSADDVARLAGSLNAQVVGSTPHFHVYQLRFKAPEQAQKALVRLKGERGVKRAIPNYLLTQSSAPHYDDDPLYNYPTESYSWWLDQSRVPPAWLVAEGFNGSGTTVGVIDAGFYDHEELTRSRITAYGTGESKHGTQVAGIIGMADNESGLLGVAPQAQLALLNLRAVTFPPLPEPRASLIAGWYVVALSELLNAIYPLVLEPETFGSPVAINISLGFHWHEILRGEYPSGTWTPTTEERRLMLEAAQDAQAVLGPAATEAELQDVVIVKSAGNQALPYEYSDLFGVDSVVVVGGTDQNDAPVWFTNFGDGVDLAAPAVDILSSCGSGPSDYCNRGPDGVDYCGTVEASCSGTSFAAPQVAGAIALLKSAVPSLEAPEAARLLIETADPINAKATHGPDLADKVTKPIGGRLNVWKAMLTAINGGRFANKIADDKWYGIEIRGASPTIERLFIGDEEVERLHKATTTQDSTVLRANVLGSALKDPETREPVRNITGLDSGGTTVLTRESVNFSNWRRFDDYVFTVAHTWHVAYVTSEGRDFYCLIGKVKYSGFEISTQLVYKNENGDTRELDTSTAEFGCRVSGASLASPRVVAKDDGTIYVAYLLADSGENGLGKGPAQIRMFARDIEGNWSNAITLATSGNASMDFGFSVSSDE